MNNATTCAFPTGCEGDPGLTKREWMATMCLQGILAACAHPEAIGVGTEDGQIVFETATAVKYADALLAALEGRR